MNDPISGESSNWNDTFTDSNGDTYEKIGWSVYGGNEYRNGDGDTFHTTETDRFNHPTTIEKDWP